MKLFQILFPELPVEFVLPLHDLKVKEAATAVLECEVNKPDVTATWTKNNEPITVADGYDIRKSQTRHSLQMSKVTTDDTAEYTITVGNKSSSAKLTVEGRVVC